MDELCRQSCRIERWRGYVASSFFVRLPDGTRVESSQFRWRRSDVPPELDAARAAYDELVDRVAALGWERHADGEPWFATEFIRFVEVPTEPEEPEHEPVRPLAPVQVAAEPVERHPVAPAASVHVAAEPVEREPVAPFAPVQIVAEPLEREPVAPLASVQVAAEPLEQEPIAPLASVQIAPRVVPQRAVPAPPPPPPAAQPPRAGRRLALVRSAGPIVRATHAGHHRIRMPRVGELLAGVVVIAVVAVVWGVVIHTLTTTPKPVPVRGQPDAVVWGNRVFANRAVFAHWLNSRGLSYRVWAKRHPDGERIITGRARPALTRRAASR